MLGNGTCLARGSNPVWVSGVLSEPLVIMGWPVFLFQKILHAIVFCIVFNEVAGTLNLVEGVRGETAV